MASVASVEREKQTVVVAPPSVSDIGHDQVSSESPRSGDTGVENETKWLYLDGAGQEFGPFVGSVMERLFTQGFFPQGRHLHVRQSSWCRHVPISSVFPEGEIPFASPLGPPGLPEMNPFGTAPPGVRNDIEDSSPHRHIIRLPTGPYKPPKVKNGVRVRAERPTVEAAELGPVQPPTDFRQDPALAYGRLKSFSLTKGFGFIESPECYERFGRDVFMHHEEKAELPIGTFVTFQVERNSQGMPQARNVRLLASPSAEGHTVEGLGVKRVPARLPEKEASPKLDKVPEATPSDSQQLQEQQEQVIGSDWDPSEFWEPPGPGNDEPVANGGEGIFQ